MTEQSIVGSPISLMLIGSDSFYGGGPASGTRRALKLDQRSVGYRTHRSVPQSMCVKVRRRQAGYQE